MSQSWTLPTRITSSPLFFPLNSLAKAAPPSITDGNRNPLLELETRISSRDLDAGPATA